jgi:hypothetical protein
MTVSPEKISTDEFNLLMQTITEGWNGGNPRKAANFSAKTRFISNHQTSLFIAAALNSMNFSAVTTARISHVNDMAHLAFNGDDQIGFGEFTFEMDRRYHGSVVGKIESGVVKCWREYQYQTGLTWEDFTSQNPL